uniref:Calbindin 2 n=1 Tax=Rousettus aegyptiacus TaxID=9407 RepID=A0A7J8CEB0_ROUAE|nr:calbindin 2 [Rousettus aegyptiacus]
MMSKSDNFGEKMKEFMQKYDKNSDGKIEMAELAQILPTEENFLLCFRQHVGSSAEFMEAWRKYDTDRSGYIEANELKGFLSDLLKKANRPYDEPKLQEYTQTLPLLPWYFYPDPEITSTPPPAPASCTHQPAEQERRDGGWAADWPPGASPEPDPGLTRHRALPQWGTNHLRGRWAGRE